METTKIGSRDSFFFTFFEVYHISAYSVCSRSKMRITRILKQDNKLKNLLYSSIKPKSNNLLDFFDKPLSELTTKRPIKDSILGLRETTKDKIVPSKVLKFICYDSMLDKSDFDHLIPHFHHRKFDFDDRAIKFDVIKGRRSSKYGLKSNGNYYLIFPSKEWSTAFYLETLDKQIVGMNFKPKFIDPEGDVENGLAELKSPSSKSSFQDEVLPFSDLPWLKSHLKVSDYINLPDQPTQQDTNDVSELPSHEPLKNTVTIPPIDRRNVVILRNMIPQMTAKELGEKLRDYSLYRVQDRAVWELENKLFIVIFDNPDDARLVVRRFNGKHWKDDPNLPVVFAEVLE